MARASKSYGPTEELVELEYLYRDAANFKFRGRAIVRGTLQPHLYESEFFFPELVGLRRLTPKSMTSDDHPWHELVDVQNVSSGESLMEARELISRFKLQDSLTWGQWAPAVLDITKSSLGLEARRR
jgi:hypothetical protein